MVAGAPPEPAQGFAGEPSRPAFDPRSASNRDLALALLERVGVPAPKEVAAALASASWGVSVKPGRLLAAAAEDRKDLLAGGRRHVRLCHPVSASDGRAVRGMLARSNWPTSLRIEPADGARLARLRLVVALASIDLSEVADPEALRRILDMAVREAFGLWTAPARGDVDRAALAARAIGEIEAGAFGEIAEAEARLAERPEVERLYGRDE